MLKKCDRCTKEYAYDLLISIPSTRLLFCEVCIDVLYFDVFGYKYPSPSYVRLIRDDTVEFITWAANMGKEDKEVTHDK